MYSDSELTTVIDLTDNGNINYYGWYVAKKQYVDAIEYRFADSVEKPLQCSEIKLRNDVTDYQVNFSHAFVPGTNSVSVWLDGIRQYNFTEADSRTVRLPEVVNCSDPTNNPITMFYVVERQETGETKSCNRQILGRVDRIDGMPNAYHSTIPLYPGVLRVFVGGLRVPFNSYRIVDAYTILFNNVVDNGEATGETEILVEIRYDYKLRELTLPIQYAGQHTWTQDDGLPVTLFNSKDLIMIYINGVAYGRDYIITSNMDHK